MRWPRVWELDPFVVDLVLGSSTSRRIIAAFIATLEFGVSFINDNSCCFGNSKNWKEDRLVLA